MVLRTIKYNALLTQDTKIMCWFTRWSIGVSQLIANVGYSNSGIK